MTNGNTIHQVKELLDNPDAITIRAALILSLQLQAEQYTEWKADHDKLGEIYPYVKEQKDNSRNSGRVAVGAAITSTVALLIHAVLEYFGLGAAK